MTHKRHAAQREANARWSRVSLALPSAMDLTEANLLVTYLRADATAIYFIGIAERSIRLHAFVPPATAACLIDLKRRIAGLLFDAAATTARAAAGLSQDPDRKTR